MARKRATKKAATPREPMPALPKDADGYLDLSGVVTPRFRFKYLRMEDGKQVEVREERDMEWVMIQLRQNLPTAFDAVDVEIVRDGKKESVPTIGLMKVVQLSMANKPIPPELPQLSNIVVATRNALELPPDMGTSEVLVLLQMFFTEWIGLEIAKKGQPDSHA